jgi:uncharacterized protein YhdP
VAGPGRIPDVGPAGNTLFKILTVINIQKIFSGKKLDDINKKGIPFDSLTYQATFQDGIMSANKLRLLSPALNLDADGNVFLVKESLDMKAQIELLGTVDTVLDLGTKDTGKAAEDVVKELGKGLEKIFGK